MSQLFATKSMEQLRAEAAETGEHSLKRVLGPVNLITLGIGAIIGTGIFVLTGQAAAQYSGPAIVLSMLLAGLVSALAGLCYAEFASSVPIAGSAYTYGYATLGEFFAWIIGWDLILEYALGAATVAVGWSGYVVSFLADFGVLIPPAFTAPYGADLVETVPAHWQILTENLATQLTNQGINPASLAHVTGIINLPAILIAMLVTILLVIGIRESANVNSVIVIVKVAVVLAVIVAGAAFVNRANWKPFIPPNQGSFGAFGLSGIARAAGVIFFAYIGFDAVSTAAQEAKNPQRDMPIGILGSLVICTVLYVAVSLVMVGLVPYTQLGVPAPMAVAIDAARTQAEGTVWAGIIGVLPFLVKLGAIAGLSSVMVVMMLGQPRIFYSMAHDGLLPAWAKKIHPRFRTPHITTIVTGIAVAVAAGFTPITILGELVSVGTLMAFVIVSLGIIFLRKNRPDVVAPFRTPWVPVVPILSAVVALALMASLPLPTWERLIVWMVVGIAIYFGYGYRHSELRKRIERAADSLGLDPVPRGSWLGRARGPWLAVALVAAICAAGTLGFSLIEGWDPWDALYMTVTTITTVGFREVHPLSRAGQVFTVGLILAGVGTAFYTFTLLASVVVDGGLHARIERRRRIRMIDELTDHFIVCGYGRIGAVIVEELRRQHVPCVVIERDHERVLAVMEAGGLAVEADASREDVLARLHIDRARGFIAAVGTDAENVYAVITARVLRPDLYIVGRAETEDAERKLLRAGANRVVSPYRIGARELAQTALRPAVVDFFQLATGAGSLDLATEQVTIDSGSPLAGHSIVEANIRQRYGLIVVGIQRKAGKMEFNPPGDAVMHEGDQLVVLGRADGLCELEASAAGPAA